MRQIIAVIVFLIISPWLAVAYIAIRMAWEVWRRHVNADRYRFSTPPQRLRFDQQHEERLFRVQHRGQTIR